MPKYKTYHGRKKNRWFKPVMLAVLVCAVAGAGFFLSNQIVDGEDGRYLDLSFLGFAGKIFRGAPSPAPEPSPDELIIEIPEPSPTEEETPSPTPKAPAQMRALFIPMHILGDATALRDIRIQAEEGGINTLALEYKDTVGTIVNPDMLAGAMAILRNSELTLTAVITVGADNTIPLGPDTHWAVKYTSALDSASNLISGGNRWLNLYLPEVREYITSLVLDAYEAGFDRVLLTHVGFPDSGGARFGAEYAGISATEAVGVLLSELREAVGDSFLDVWLFEQTYESGHFERAGQDLEAFTGAFDLMFVPAQDDVMDRPFVPIVELGNHEGSIELSTSSFMLYDKNGEYFQGDN